MTKTTQKILLTIITILVLIGAGFFVYKNYFSNNSITDFADRIKTPAPLVMPNTQRSADQMDDEQIIYWTNWHRDQENLAPLGENEQLTEAAELKVDDMFANQYFEHVSPIDGHDVTYWVGEVNYAYLLVGENLALGDFVSEEELVQAWMDSEGHRANIMNPEYTEIGVAAKKGEYEGRYTWIAVQIFGRPSSDCPNPDASLKSEIELKQSEYSQIDDLNSQAETLQTTGNSLIEQGNEKIRQGNEVLKNTHDESQAKPFWEEGESLQAEGQAKLDEASKLIDQIKSLEPLYDEIQNLINEYNNQVNAYNKCLGI